ncbi:hypothetical protein AAC387_Pa05g2378 [Persea americana]
MDSLLANYASDDEEEEQEKTAPLPSKPISLSLPKPSFNLDSTNPPPKTSFFSSLPPQKPISSSSSSKPSSLSLPKPSLDLDSTNPHPKTSIFSSLPPPKPISSSSSKPISASSSSSSSSTFSSLPRPKSHQSIPSKPPTNPKRVVQFRPPLNPSLFKTSSLDEDDDDEEEQEKERKTTKETPSSTSKSSFSSFLPPPKNSLGIAPPRRPVIDSNVAAKSEKAPMPQQEKDPYSNHRNHEGNLVGTTPGAENYSNHVNYGYYEGNWVDGSSAVALETPGNAPSNGNYVNYGSYEGNLADGSSAVALETSANVPVNENYGSYVDYGGYESNWGDVSTATKAPEKSGGIDWAGGILGKRGRNEIPADIIEVKQDELMSNRPREDQAKLTGIAFGPAYQPVSSAKGKPSKLHKRKHQIGSLYFDMKQKEMELVERRARGFLTKAETQGKYGW